MGTFNGKAAAAKMLGLVELRCRETHGEKVALGRGTTTTAETSAALLHRWWLRGETTAPSQRDTNEEEEIESCNLNCNWARPMRCVLC